MKKGKCNPRCTHIKREGKQDQTSSTDSSFNAEKNVMQRKRKWKKIRRKEFQAVSGAERNFPHW